LRLETGNTGRGDGSGMSAGVMITVVVVAVVLLLGCLVVGGGLVFWAMPVGNATPMAPTVRAAPKPTSPGPLTAEHADEGEAAGTVLDADPEIAAGDSAAGATHPGRAEGEPPHAAEGDASP
jgi:hypothetical protein